LILNYAIANVSVAPVRVRAAHTSEQITQLLFGETVEILHTQGKKWIKIKCSWDNCVGWVSTNQVLRINASDYESFNEQFAYNLDLLHPLMSKDQFIPISIGSRLPLFDGIRFKMLEESFDFSGQAVQHSDLSPNLDLLFKIARKYLHAPYQWGGRSILGIDASGLAQMVYMYMGVSLRRTAEAQVHQGENIDFVLQCQAGDLAFFENKKGNISHVGIVMPEGQIIHCDGRVRMDRIDHFGIYNEAQKKYTHKLRVVRRLVNHPTLKTTHQPIVESTPVPQKEQTGMLF